MDNRNLEKANELKSKINNWQNVKEKIISPRIYRIIRIKK